MHFQVSWSNLPLDHSLIYLKLTLTVTMLSVDKLALFSRARTLKDQERVFFEQGDFGYIKTMKDQVMDLCEPDELVC